MTISRRVFSTLLLSAQITDRAYLHDAAPESDPFFRRSSRRFDEIANAIEDADIRSIEFEDAVDALDAIRDDICKAEAKTLEELFVKAKVACWARLGDLTITDEMTTDEMMAFSIVRDLIKLHAPEMENPGALAKLLERFE